MQNNYTIKKLLSYIKKRGIELKKLFILVMALCLFFPVLSSNDFVSAKGSPQVKHNQSDQPGVTVEADATSPTGYYATFVFEDETKKATKVELYSDCFNLFTLEDGFGKIYRPEEYKPGMFPAGGNAATTYFLQMENIGGNFWRAKVPLSSGAFVYNFRITNPDGTTTSRLDDPNNPTLTNSATGISSLSSMVYVPYNPKTMGKGEWTDRSVELPIAEKKAGKVETVSYIGANNDKRGLAVYLPNGYNPNRKKPYKVLYLSHGMSGDKYGNELRWMNEGAVANINDNLMANGAVEPFVVVTMNNQDFLFDFNKVEQDQFEYIMPFIESNYNVYDTPEGRAYAGLSMGGMTANRMYFNHADEFSYFGIWSYAVTGDELTNIENYKNLNKPSVMVGAGTWDFGLEPVKDLHATLTEQGIKADYLEIPAAHDWEVWQLFYASFVEDYLWKADKYKDKGKVKKN